MTLSTSEHPKNPPSVGDRLVYAIGDVHGRLDLFLALLDAIISDSIAAAPVRQPLIIPLGDYIDRGPDSAGVLSLLVDLRQSSGLEVRPLRGNHEQAMISFLGDARVGPTWARFGGLATLASYGVTPPQPHHSLDIWEETRKALQAAVPETHMALLHEMDHVLVIEDYAFVHAGLRPGVALDEQTEEDLLWIRQDFLEHGKWLGKRIVHGHTAQLRPQVLSWRLGIDTGAYASGTLTAVRLHKHDQALIHARDTPES